VPETKYKYGENLCLVGLSKYFLKDTHTNPKAIKEKLVSRFHKIKSYFPSKDIVTAIL
jgi:hypothetical protein